MPNPLDALWENRPVLKASPSKPQPKLKAKVDFTEAREIYERYLEKAKYLKAQREYADKVAKATSGAGQTPVRPLATMGCNGGPLLCDYCNTPIILESSPCYNVPADVAWARFPNLHETKWVSYIKGGMIVEIVENDTLRIYHGYENVTGHCCTKARMERQAEEATFIRDTSKIGILVKFLEAEFGNTNLLSDIVKVIFSFDPGVGVNRA